MYYSVIGILALLILNITNHDVIIKRTSGVGPSIQKHYRRFLFGIIAYYLTDIAWGILETYNQTQILFFDTEVYFITMALSIFLWSRYVIAYLGGDVFFRSFLYYTGQIFFVFVVVVIAINLMYPTVFWFDNAGGYHAAIGRYVILVAQLAILILTAGFAIYVALEKRNAEANRFVAIALSSITMLVLIFIQLFFPYLPLYSIGFMLSTCMLRSFVIEIEKEEYRKSLELSFTELNSAWKLAYTDAMTGVKSKLAYLQKQEKLDNSISDGTAEDFAVAVFDVNDLKQINDTLGHEAGDRYIKAACKLISNTFKHSPLFRTGGDEFVCILEGYDYENRDPLMKIFNKIVEKNKDEKRVVISLGVAVYHPEKDHSFKKVFERADHRMYNRKKELKAM